MAQDKQGFYGEDGEFYPSDSSDKSGLYPKRPEISYSTMPYSSQAAPEIKVAKEITDTAIEVKEFAGATKFCKYCGQKIPMAAVICTHCGCQVEEFKTAQAAQTQVVNVQNTVYRDVEVHHGLKRSRTAALLLCFFGGFLGLHKFYEHKIILGILYLCTFGLFGIGTLLDFIKLIFRKDTYYIE